MNALEKKSWEEVRQRGRNRFLLRSIGRVCWMFAIPFAVGRLAFVLFAKRPIQPWDWLAQWAFISVCLGAVWGLLDWEDKEKHYHESNQDGEGHSASAVDGGIPVQPTSDHFCPSATDSRCWALPAAV